MKEISLHLLDIAENSIEAGAKNIQVIVKENMEQDRLSAFIQDDGRGMDKDTITKVIDPFVTSRTTRKVGLGIPLLKAAAESCNGCFNIQSEQGKGTLVEVHFQLSHIDRMPLGDLSSTFLALLVSYPCVHWIFEYHFIPLEIDIPEGKFYFDDLPIKEELSGISFCEPEVLTFIREWLDDGIKNAKYSTMESIA